MLMKPSQMERLAKIDVSPYVALATMLICKGRKMAGNQFRHQAETRAILIDYGYVDSILHKAALIHDIIEDIETFDPNLIINADEEGEDVYSVVLEVTQRPGESKGDFLTRIYHTGSFRAKLIKCADRISNMHDLGLISGVAFIERYCDETEKYIMPIAKEVELDMCTELLDLLKSRRSILELLRKLPV